LTTSENDDVQKSKLMNLPRSSEEAGDLISEAGVVGVFHHGHQLYGVVTFTSTFNKVYYKLTLFSISEPERIISRAAKTKKIAIK